MRSKTSIPQKNRTKSKLVNLTWFQILQVIGESNRPISGREIEITWYNKYKMRGVSGAEKDKKKIKKGVKGSIGPDGKRKYIKEMSHSDIYRIIRRLAGFPSRNQIFLCSLNKIFPFSNEKDQEYLKKTLNKIRKLVGVSSLNFDENDLIQTEFRADSEKTPLILAFKKWSTSTRASEQIIMEIIMNFNKEVIIPELKIPDVRAITLYIKSNKQEVSFYISEDDTVRSYLTRRFPPFIQYSLKKRAETKISMLREGMKSTPFRDADANKIIEGLFHYWPSTESDKMHLLEIEQIKNNSRNFMYFLTLEGFLYYLTGTGTYTPKEINKVIESLSQNDYVENDFPFLWKNYIFNETHGLNYKVNTLIEIAIELQNQIVSSDKKSLLYWIIRRFRYSMIYNQSFLSRGPIYKDYFNAFWRRNIRQFHKGEKIDQKHFVHLANELREYDQRMLEFMKEYEEKQLKQTSFLLENLQTDSLSKT